MDAEDLPPGWAWATLGEIAEAPQSVSPARVFADKPSFTYVDLSAVNGGQITDAQTIKPSDAPSRARQMIRAGDTLFSCVRVYLENIAFVTKDFCGQVASTAYAVLRPRDGIDPRYLYWLTRQPSFIKAMTEAQRGNSPPAVQEDDVRGATVPIAPASEQARIAAAVNALFDELDEAAAALARAREGVEQFRASLLHAACTGQLTAAWRAANPPTETGADLLRRILAERRTAWEGTECARLEARGTLPRGDAWKARYVEPVAPDLTDMPDLPEGWVTTPLRLLVIEGPTNGYSPKASRSEDGTLSLKLTATTKGIIDLSSRAIKRLSEQIDPSSNLFLKNSDLLFQRGNTPEYVGISAIFRGPENLFVYPDLMIRVRSGQDFITEWLWRVANSPVGRRHMQQAASGTAGTMPKITGETVRELPVPLPPEAELREIMVLLSTSLEDARDAAEQLEALDDDLSRLRQSILHAAFTGRLVPQDPTDEPAAALLVRLRGTAPPGRRTRRRTPAEVPA